MFQRPIRIIGLDIGAYCLKAALLEKHPESGEILLRHYATYDRPQIPERLDVSISKLVKKLRTRVRLCAVAVWPERSVLRFTQRNSDSPIDLKNLQDKTDPLTSDLEDYILDFADLGSLPNNEGGKNFLICGSPREAILELMQTLANARLDVAMVQLMPVAISNAFHFSQSNDTRKNPFLFADVGARQTHISGGHSGKVLLLRTVPWGALDFQERLRSAPKGRNATEDALEYAAKPLVQELKSSADFLQIEDESSTDTLESAFHFVAATHGADRITQIHLSGYLGTSREFVEAVTQGCGLPCFLWNPFQKLIAGERPLQDYKLLEELCRLPGAAGVALQYLL